MIEPTRQPLIELRAVQRHFPVSGLGFRSSRRWVRAVDGVSFAIGEGETFGLVGESGCGKTTVAKLILDIERPTAGEIRFKGVDTKGFDKRQRQAYRFGVQAVFQDPWSSLNPRMKASSIISEPLRAQKHLSKAELGTLVGSLLEEVGLPPAAANQYPHEFSGGQRQRIAIARALASRPDLITLDEPVSALDVSIRAQIMNLLKELQKSRGVSYLLIAHQLATVRHMCDRVGVMYLGKIVEQGPSERIFGNPLHPYTKALLSASLVARPNSQADEIVLPGEVPSPINPPGGCAFHPRCAVATPSSSTITPGLQEVEPGHWVACHLYTPMAG
jgi:oligopeptide/dipeptide ABC transporter ATP-binding protein